VGKILRSEDELRRCKINVLETIFGDPLLHTKLNNNTITDKMIIFVETGASASTALRILQQPESPETLKKLLTAATEFKKISPYKPK